MSARVMRTWEKVADPRSEIEGVRDRDGDLWRPGRDRGWVNCSQVIDLDEPVEPWRKLVARVGEPWETVLIYAPLREVTEAGERVGPIEVTQAMTDAADAVLLERGAANLTGGTIAAVLAAALRAEGYEVTGVDEQ